MKAGSVDKDASRDGGSNNNNKRRRTTSSHPKGKINGPVPDAEVTSAPIQLGIAPLAQHGNTFAISPIGNPMGFQRHRMQNPPAVSNEAAATMGMQQYATQTMHGQLPMEQSRRRQEANSIAPKQQILASERDNSESKQSASSPSTNEKTTGTRPSQETDRPSSDVERQQQEQQPPNIMPTVPLPSEVTTQIQQYLAKVQEELQKSQNQYQEQIRNQYSVLRNDLQHLEKKCNFLEKQCDMYRRRQRKMEKLFFMRKSSKRKSIGGDDGDNDAESNSQHRNGDDISIDEDAAEEFFGGDDEVEIQSDESIDGANDDDTDGSEEKKSKPKRRRRRKTKSDYEGSIVPDHIVHSPSELNFETMFDKLRQFQQQHGTCSVPKEYDSQLHTWVGHWKSRRKQFEEMVAEEGGPDVVFPGLGDIADKSLGKDLPEYDYEWENERVKHIEPSTRSKAQNRRRYLLRTRYRIQRLNTLGFVWAIKKQPKFEDRLVQLQAYIDEFGHYNVPREYGDLGEWFHKVKGKFVFQTKLFMEKQYPKLLEMGVDMSVAVEGRRRRRRKKKSDVTNISEGAGGTRTDGDVSLES